MKKMLFIVGLLVSIAGSSLFARAASQQPAQVSQEITMRLLTDATGIDDKSFNAASWRGILQFYGDTWDNPSKRGVSYDVVTAQTQDMFLPILLQATDEKYDLIVATSFMFGDILMDVAGRNPNQKYLIIDVDWVNLPNVMQAVYAEHEGSYLVGVAAALKAKADGVSAPRFGFIGGIPGATITKFEVGFIQGVLSVIPDAQIVDYYVNDWGNPALAKTQAKNWYDSGVYAIYSAAGASGNGTIAQAKEYRLQGKNVWAIGVDSDQYEEGVYNGTDSAVLTSMVKRVETSLLYGLNAVKNGTFTGEAITFDLQKDGVNYSTSNSALTADISAQLEAVKQQIISGQLVIASTYAEAKALPGFPQDLHALDD